MIWGCNYDALLRWGLTGADASKVTGTGNAAHDLSSVYETGKNTIVGKDDRINNVYDLEGNGYELTAEAYTTNHRSRRGGYYKSSINPSNRYNHVPTYPDTTYCSRVALYIK
ncbi:MAG: hypothetical protein HFJ38_08385 [Bacilli bacterium]|nr:hypothetical protein [Bacilli bacterium]